MIYAVAERFKSLQGEGLYSGTPMAFIRFVGCSVGKRICTACDTDFDTPLAWRGGGNFTEQMLYDWAKEYDHICLTGGEPMDQDLRPLFNFVEMASWLGTIHIETSGTLVRSFPADTRVKTWICVSPKPGFLEEEVLAADEVKVIVPGLGSDKNLKVVDLVGKTSEQIAEEIRTPKRWPGLEDALRWAAAGKLVYLQPRNGKFDIDSVNLMYVQDLLREHPSLRLSVQAHKILKVQ